MHVFCRPSVNDNQKWRCFKSLGLINASLTKPQNLLCWQEVWRTVSHGTEFDDVNTQPEVFISSDKSNVSMFDFGPSGCDPIAKWMNKLDFKSIHIQSVKTEVWKVLKLILDFSATVLRFKLNRFISGSRRHFQNLFKCHGKTWPSVETITKRVVVFARAKRAKRSARMPLIGPIYIYILPVKSSWQVDDRNRQ